jgi:hypothetical protein
MNGPSRVRVLDGARTALDPHERVGRTSNAAARGSVRWWPKHRSRYSRLRYRTGSEEGFLNDHLLPALRH